MAKDIKVFRKKKDAQDIADAVKRKTGSHYRVAALAGGGYIVARAGSILVSVS